MFTGLIRGLGTVTRRDAGDSGARLSVAAHGLTLGEGDSIAIDGVCLTALEPNGEGFSADISAETLARTTLGALRPGDRVNLEPSLRLGDKLDGHWVSGHVDAVAEVVAVTPDEQMADIRVRVPSALRHLIAAKGSVAVNGVSLTVNEVCDAVFSVYLIPHTRRVTNLGQLAAGDRVNLEADLLARYTARVLQTGGYAADPDPPRGQT